MGIENILSLIGGLALFLYGMHQMGNGLEVAAGDRMQAILEKLTSNRFIGIIVGAGITALVQSSSATTVMVIGFVNSGLMKLDKAVWVIMGANVGTTITGQLIALDISAIAPIFAIVGTVMIAFMKNKKANSIGEIIGGLGILFIGMGMMSGAMKPLQNEPDFVNLMANFSNPLLGILAGALFTAVIQSSSASIGILQSMAAAGIIPLHSAVYVLFGQNIGTCITSLIASLSANRNAKRATLVHFLFNMIGTVIFVSLSMILPFTDWVAALTGGNVMAQIANVHTIFNISTTIILLPFGKWLADVTYKIIPIKDDEREDSVELKLLSDQRFGSALVAMTSLKKEIVQMFILTKKSLNLTYDVFVNGKKLNREKIDRNEEIIDRINFDINKFMADATALDMQESESAKCNAMLKLSVDIERIGDHIVNLAEYAYMINMKEINFDSSIINELEILYKNLQYVQQVILEEDIFDEEDLFKAIADHEEQVDQDTASFRSNQIDRLKKKTTDPKTGIIYSEMLTDLERISDYLMNVAEGCNAMNLSFKDVTI